MRDPIVHTAQSASDAEIWLADLELDSGRPLSRVSWDEAGGGRVTVTVELGETPVPEQGTGDNSSDGRCVACGGQLPHQTGPGRRRRYCSDTCRYRDKKRRPRPPQCQMRAGAWRCTQQAEWGIREAEIDGAQAWVPAGFTAAMCELCADACEEFALRQDDVWHVKRQPVQEWLAQAEHQGTGDISVSGGGRG